MISGLYMLVVPLEVIHGDHLVHVESEPLNPARSRVQQDQLDRLYPGISALRLKSMLSREVYEVKQGKQALLVDAGSGKKISPLDSATIEALAKSMYAGDGGIRSIEWVGKAPQEVGARPAPLWAVHYDDTGDTTLYFSPYTGELVARRHSLWRWFDLLWMLHIMDYQERDNVNNLLLRVAALTGAAFALSGAWLLLYSFKRGKRA